LAHHPLGLAKAESPEVKHAFQRNHDIFQAVRAA
jgi:hypothetical protein